MPTGDPLAQGQDPVVPIALLELGSPPVLPRDDLAAGLRAAPTRHPEVRIRGLGGVVDRELLPGVDVATRGKGERVDVPEVRIAAVVAEVDVLPRRDHEVLIVVHRDAVDVGMLGVLVGCSEQGPELLLRYEPAAKAYDGCSRRDRRPCEESSALDGRGGHLHVLVDPALSRRKGARHGVHLDGPRSRTVPPMAGFDFDFECQERDRELGRALLRRLQRLAKNFGLELRYRAQEVGWYVTVDGPLTGMQPLLLAVYVDLEPFSEGFPQPPSPARRRRIAHALAKAYTEGVEGMTETVFGLSEELGGATPFSYLFDEGPSTHLSPYLRDFELTLMRYHAGQLSASQVAEEAHTVVENVSKAALPKEERTGTFMSLVGQVAERAGLRPEELAALERLNRRRVGVKHRSQRLRDSELIEDLSTIVLSLQQVLGYLRESA